MGTDDTNGSDLGGSSSSDRPIVCVRCDTRDDQGILSDPRVFWAYPISIIIMAVGVVLLCITLAVLSFFYPDKANAFLLLLGGPMVGLVLAHNSKAVDVVKKLVKK